MLLKGSQRGGGANLANHLTNTRENDHVEIAEVRGTISHDLHTAFQEIEASASLTNAQKAFFSVSFNPPEASNMTREQFDHAIEAVEQKMGLQDQPRAVVYHEKQGREHAHVIWSRIDTEAGKAIEIPFDRLKLRDVSRQLHREFGLNMPKGLEKETHWYRDTDQLNYSRAVWQQSLRIEEDPRDLKKIIGEAYQFSDNAKSFNAALETNGMQLARGDRRGFVVVHHSGEVLGLRQYLGARQKDIRSRLGKPEHVQTVDQARSLLGDRMTAAASRRLEDMKARHAKERKPMTEAVKKLRTEHREARAHLQGAQKAREGREAVLRSQKYQKGVKGLWERLNAKMGIGRIARENKQEIASAKIRDRKERHDLKTDQLKERRQLQKAIKFMRRKHKSERQSERNVIGHYLRGDHERVKREATQKADATREFINRSRGRGRGRSRTRKRDGPSFER